MKRIFFVIMFLIWMGFLAGCRASKESKARSERTAESEIGVELRKADSLWSSIAERLTMKIEFYPLEYSIGNGTPTAFTGASLPAAPCSTVPAGVANPLPWQAQGVGAGGMGAALRQAQGPALRQAQGPLAQGGIKSIEITAESGTSTGSVTAVDSTYEQKSATTETRQEEKSVGGAARQWHGHRRCHCRRRGRVGLFSVEAILEEMMRAIQIEREVVACISEERDGKVTSLKTIVMPLSMWTKHHETVQP